MQTRLYLVTLSVAAALALTACGKKPVEQNAGASAPAVAAAPAAAAPVAAPTVAPGEISPEARELARKQGLLDFGVMEDKYINDPRGQWAASATASSAYGEENKSEQNVSTMVTGKVDGKTWTNNTQSIGFDWLNLGYEKPVSATEVRVVFQSGEGVEAVNKIELIGTDGAARTVWTGISDVKRDERGGRTWFVRKFNASPYKVKGVKVTIANNLQSGYKVIDAVQLVGE
jgi:hypothetical protein